ncbi:hypothetical protein [Janthinobacterium sp. PC23-8]|uniref:hypothetical protein n=1 Tax=Janthinobacterium sp. PC23-8 TaxID=2012679 RepID=UPI000B95CB45|nr:hypothetical protein [Janthinobacterium sp. PC23-8]OYO28904.1 hypothetical protein CD932_17355 [Janthinobacterium sp. PC23-8]
MSIRNDLSGAGYMGEVHAITCKSARSIFNTALTPVCKAAVRAMPPAACFCCLFHGRREPFAPGPAT